MTLHRPCACLFALIVPLTACDLGPEVGDEDAQGSDASTRADPTDADGESDGSHTSDCAEDESSSGEVATDTPPELAITLPAMDLEGDEGPTYDGFDDDLELWYVDVDLAATAVDLEDGDLGDSVEWSTDQGVQDMMLGTGASTTVRLYSDECFGTLHTITATVFDSDGNEASAQRLINIWTLC
jgi:hypothetical protein